jgi:hypothetical protein
LHPIVIVAETHQSNSTDPDPETGYQYVRDGALSFDYSDSITVNTRNQYPNWFAPGQTGSGVWYTSGPISNTFKTNPYVTTRYSVGSVDAPITTIPPHDPTLQFFRAHITQANLLATINGINSTPNTGPSPPYPGPTQGYSTNPANYVLEYAGAIPEGPLGLPYDVSPTNWISDDPNKDQFAFGVHVQYFSVFQYTPQLQQLGVYRNNSTVHKFLLDYNHDSVPDLQLPFGITGDVGRAADMDGDGLTDLILFRSGTWYVDTNKNGTVDLSDSRAGRRPATWRRTVARHQMVVRKMGLIVYRNGIWYGSGDHGVTVNFSAALGGIQQTSRSLGISMAMEKRPVIYRNGFGM